MRYNLKGTGISITQEIREYLEKKLSSTEKFLQDDTGAHADIELEYSQLRDGGKYRAEFTVSTHGRAHRAEEWGSTMHEAIDTATGVLVKELRRNKSKHMRMVRHGAKQIKDFVRGFRDRF